MKFVDPECSHENMVLTHHFRTLTHLGPNIHQNIHGPGLIFPPGSLEAAIKVRKNFNLEKKQVPWLWIKLLLIFHGRMAGFDHEK